MKMIAASLSRPGATTRLSTIRTTKDRADPPQPSVRDAMLAAVPSLRAFAISLSGNVDRADDLVQETLLRAIANINSFHPGTNMSAWLFAILRNLFRTEYRKRRREVEDADGANWENGTPGWHLPSHDPTALRSRTVPTSRIFHLRSGIAIISPPRPAFVGGKGSPCEKKKGSLCEEES
jgi:hypothetical protein